MNRFIKCGNQTVCLEHVCGAEYKKFGAQDSKFLGYSSSLRIFTVDGKEVLFLDRNADQMWELLNSAALDVTPVEGEQS